MIKFKYIVLLIIVGIGIKLAWDHYGFQAIGTYKNKNAYLALGETPADEVKKYAALFPLHHIKKPPQPGDWLATVTEEGQTYDAFVASEPRKPVKDKEKIYITLIGDFDEKYKQILNETVRYIKAFYGLPVAFTDPVPVSSIPAPYQRINAFTRQTQLLTTYIIEDVLLPHKPKDAFANIALTTVDLWPGQGWNFVFGQADPQGKVGVWSLARNGDPNGGFKEYTLCLRRTISMAVHELSHMFGLAHCIYFECNINGSNHQKESDERPLWLCPICLRKLNWALEETIEDRYTRLLKACRRNNFIIEKNFYEKSLDRLKRAHQVTLLTYK